MMAHTLGPVIADLEKLTGVMARHNHGTRAIAATTIRTGSRSGSPAKSSVSPGPSAARCAAELQSTHRKDDHRMGCSYLQGRDGDRINAVLAALRWFEESLRALLLDAAFLHGRPSSDEGLDIDRLFGLEQRQRQRHRERDQRVNSTGAFSLVKLASSSWIAGHDCIGSAPLQDRMSPVT